MPQGDKILKKFVLIILLMMSMCREQQDQTTMKACKEMCGEDTVRKLTSVGCFCNYEKEKIYINCNNGGYDEDDDDD